jgi:hypothetical protein
VIKYPEPLDDIISNENNPLDFNTMITLKINEGKSPVLLKNYGTNWYENNIVAIVWMITQTATMLSRMSLLK